jgi:uncharacterized transporter YbjL
MLCVVWGGLVVNCLQKALMDMQRHSTKKKKKIANRIKANNYKTHPEKKTRVRISDDLQLEGYGNEIHNLLFYGFRSVARSAGH